MNKILFSDTVPLEKLPVSPRPGLAWNTALLPLNSPFLKPISFYLFFFFLLLSLLITLSPLLLPHHFSSGESDFLTLDNDVSWDVSEPDRDSAPPSMFFKPSDILSGSEGQKRGGEWGERTIISTNNSIVTFICPRLRLGTGNRPNWLAFIAHLLCARHLVRSRGGTISALGDLMGLVGTKQKYLPQYQE